MTRKDWTHWGALGLVVGIAVFAGFRVVYLVLTGDTSIGLVGSDAAPEMSMLVLGTIALIVLGIAGWVFGGLAFRARYWSRSGRTGRIGLGILVFGILVLAVGHLAIIPFALTGQGGFLRAAIWDAAMLMNIGLIVFGVAAIKQKILPKWRYLPAATGAVGVLFLTNLAAPTAVFLTLRGLFAFGWLLLAYLLWTGSGSAVQRPLSARAAAPV